MKDRVETALEKRLLVASVDPPCPWFQEEKRCTDCCILCVSFEMCIKRWKKGLRHCPLLFTIHYCSAIQVWYGREERKKVKERK